MKTYLFLALISIFCFSIIANAQSKNGEKITWDELKIVQNQERQLLENRQKEELNSIFQAQKEQLATLKAEASANANDLLILIDKQKTEKVELLKNFSEERTKLAQIHSEERKLFFQKQ
jgi:hypothetical protein